MDNFSQWVWSAHRALAVIGLLAMGSVHAAPTAGLTLKPCRLAGIEHEARCGTLKRPLDPAQPQGTQIEVRVAVLPAVARHKKPDPVVFLAGGPGQSAIGLAQPIAQMVGRFMNRRDVVLIDQRGTGHSAPLTCPTDNPGESMALSLQPERQRDRWRACIAALKALPHGDLRHYTTSVAMADVDAVRQALGVEQVNLVGASYGTRAALEYLRLYPQQVRRVVLDGVAPPDMVLPASFAQDTQAALEALMNDCEHDARCQRHYPQLRSDWKALLSELPRTGRVLHPVTGREETLTVNRDQVLQWVRAPLYTPALAAALPHAITEARAGRFTPLVGLASPMAGPRGLSLAMGMHLAVVCAEDMPRLSSLGALPATDFGDSLLNFYRESCALLPPTPVPAAFYSLPTSATPVLLLSGGADPATPPRHAERVAQALGAQARHVVVPQAGHGTLSLGCVRDAVFRFVDDEAPGAALNEVSRDAACAAKLPRPPVFVPVQPRASNAKVGDPS